MPPGSSTLPLDPEWYKVHARVCTQQVPVIWVPRGTEVLKWLRPASDWITEVAGEADDDSA